MKTFSVCEQSVSDPVSGLAIRFEVDADDTSVVRCIITPAESNDFVRMIFRRGGTLVSSEMVDHEYEEDKTARERATTMLARMNDLPGSPVTEANRKSAEEANQKQIAEAHALLDSEPKKSRYDRSAPGAPVEGRILDPNDPRFSYVGAADPASRKTGVADPDIERTLRPLDAVRAAGSATVPAGPGASGVYPQTDAQRAEAAKNQQYPNQPRGPNG